MEDKKLNFSDEIQGKQLIFTRKKDWFPLDKTSTSVTRGFKHQRRFRHRQQNPPVISHIKALRNWTSQHVLPKKNAESLWVYQDPLPDKIGNLIIMGISRFIFWNFPMEGKTSGNDISKFTVYHQKWWKKLAINMKFFTEPHQVGSLPSGKHTQNYGKSPFLLGKSTINGHFQ